MKVDLSKITTETLFSIANVLKEKGFAKEISAFTITKTRTKK